ncbi:MAG: hypothetical protein CR982_00565 [Candidatus Cloacimonadota bacterium]|nr:MAG: hypothetical protein CR982_00565 [Candidatus Cloacimonadota bacterium]PIE78878.1 MAG: hypothetical protein CSA15_05665 [Candidatus Delongbacteria bacterium]
MKIFNKKGGVLIFALVLLVMIGLAITGIYYLSKRSIDSISREKVKTELFWAAEAGANTAVKWKINRSPGNLSDYNFSRNGISVSLTEISFGKDGFLMKSKATNKNNQCCEITIDDLGNKVGPLGNSLYITHMFKSRKELGNGDEIYGNVHFCDIFNFAGYPIFHGLVTSSSNKRSACSKGDVLKYENALNDPNTTNNNLAYKGCRYHMGIWEKTVLQGANTFESLEDTEYRYDDIFRGGYKFGVPPESVENIPEKVAYSWEDFVNNSAGDAKVKLAMKNIDRKNTQFRNIDVKVNGDKVILEYEYIRYKLVAGVPWYKRKSSTIDWGSGLDPKADWKSKTETINLSQKNTLLIPEFKPFINTLGEYNREYRNSMVRIKGRLSKDFTLITEANNVGISGDLYYDGLQHYANMSGYDYAKDKNPDKHGNPNIQTDPDIVEKVKNKVAQQGIFCGIIAGINKPADIGPIGGGYLGGGCLANQGNSGRDQVGGRNNSMLVTASIYSPYGNFGPLAIDPKYTYSPLYWVPANINEDTRSRYRFISIGSVIAKGIGDFRWWHGVNAKKRGYWKYLGTVGILPAFISDSRLERGKVPIGFKDFSEEANSLSHSFIWNVKYSNI